MRESSVRARRLREPMFPVERDPAEGYLETGALAVARARARFTSDQTRDRARGYDQLQNRVSGTTGGGRRSL